MGFNAFSPFGTASLGSTSHMLAALNEVAVLLPVFLLIFTWRGFAQALSAKLMGDTSPEEDGFLTLNPLAHIDLVGLLTILAAFFAVTAFLSGAVPSTVLLMMLIMLGVRWTYPVQVDDTRFTNYRLGGVVTSLTGPFSNFLLAFLAVGAMKLVLQVGMAQFALVSFLEIFKTLVRVAIFFGVIDLIPLPPFDGGKLLRYLLPYSQQHIVQKLEEYSLIIMLVVFFMPGVSQVFFGGLFMLATLIKHFFFWIFF